MNKSRETLRIEKVLKNARIKHKEKTQKVAVSGVQEKLLLDER